MFPFPLYLITDPLLYSSKEGIEKNKTTFEISSSAKDHGAQLDFDAIEQAMEGGARLVQYREKKGTRREMYETAKKLRELTASRNVTLIINDEIDLALAVRADGVHLGQDDLPIWIARKLLGKESIIGISTHSLGQALRAESEGADYIGFGPVFKTSTKESQNPPLGVKAVAETTKQVRIPLYVIGGIQLSDLPELMGAGAAGVAAISALSGDIRLNVSRWLAFFENHRKT